MIRTLPSCATCPPHRSQTGRWCAGRRQYSVSGHEASSCRQADDRARTPRRRLHRASWGAYLSNVSSGWVENRCPHGHESRCAALAKTSVSQAAHVYLECWLISHLFSWKLRLCLRSRFAGTWTSEPIRAHMPTFYTVLCNSTTLWSYTPGHLATEARE